uniref:aquaporin-9-like n=1 Tax=Pristiophorus japonicus TaxID=55135 RepID=UPI00398F1558
MSQVGVDGQLLTPAKRMMGKASSSRKILREKIRIKNRLVRECLAEFIGTYMLMLLGISTVAQVVTNHDQKGTYLSIAMGYASGVLFGIYSSVGVSGAHLNPAVSFSLCLLGRFSWKKLPFYCVAQFLGSFCAAATAFCVYYDAIHQYGNGNLTVTGPRGTAGIFATYPATGISTRNAFITEIVATAVLLICILCVVDEKNAGAPPFMRPPLIAVSVLIIGIGLGANTGYAINPARDFAPRLFTYLAGWGVEVFTAGNGWWWIPLVAPMLGGPLGCLAYELIVELHHEDAKVLEVRALPATEEAEETAVHAV